MMSFKHLHNNGKHAQKYRMAWDKNDITNASNLSKSLLSDGESNPCHHGDSAIFRPLDHLGVTSIAADFELYHK